MEQLRLAEIKAQQVAAGLEPAQAESAKPHAIMPAKTRDALKVLVAALRKANGQAEAAPAASPRSRPAPIDPKDAPDPAIRPEPAKADRRATLFDTSHDDLSIPATAPGGAAPGAPSTNSPARP